MRQIRDFGEGAEEGEHLQTCVDAGLALGDGEEAGWVGRVPDCSTVARKAQLSLIQSHSRGSSASLGWAHFSTPSCSVAGWQSPQEAGVQHE